MLDGVVNKKGLLWEFPWWQMISCLMCAQSVIMITQIVYPCHEDSAGLQADTGTLLQSSGSIECTFCKRGALLKDD